MRLYPGAAIALFALACIPASAQVPQVHYQRVQRQQQPTQAARDAFASTLTRMYRKGLLAAGADPNRVYFTASTHTADSIAGLVINTNAAELPAQLEAFFHHASWVDQAYGLGFRVVRVINGTAEWSGVTACDVEIVNTTTLEPGSCWTESMDNGANFHQQIIRQWPRGYRFTIK